MEDIEHAKIEVRAATGNAGDASGSADEAAYLFERGDIAEAADKMKFAREQAEKAMRCAAQAEWRLRRLIATANADVTGLAPGKDEQ
jgi:hypothetical protein